MFCKILSKTFSIFEIFNSSIFLIVSSIVIILLKVRILLTFCSNLLIELSWLISNPDFNCNFALFRSSSLILPLNFINSLIEHSSGCSKFSGEQPELNPNVPEEEY